MTRALCPLCHRPLDEEAPPRPALRLTPREQQVARLLANGLSNDAIAVQLGISKQTVKNFVTILIRKFGVNRRVQVALCFERGGWRL